MQPTQPSLFGVLTINKPKNLTSHDVVARLRKVFNLKKVGHLGTLDPMATGILPVCIGNATRLIEYFPNEKAYQATFVLGYETTTLDAEGEILPQLTATTETLTALRQLTTEAINKHLATFVGEQQQRVPRFSAVHVRGKKLYHYAHQGIIIPEEELPIKPITIHSLSLTSWQPQAKHPTITIQVACSSGTYIRSLVRDIAAKLGTVATLTALERTHHGHFTLANTVALETLQTSETPTDWLQQPFDFLPFKRLLLPSTEAVALFLNGMPLTEEQLEISESPHNNQQFMVFTPTEEQFIGIAKWHNYRLRAEKVFHPA
jgi:tRNA pseudouridine55 synthase